MASVTRARPVGWTYDVPARPPRPRQCSGQRACRRGISDLRPARNQATVGRYRDLMLDQLFGGMLGARLNELSQRENPPFIKAAADRALFPMPRTRDEALLEALVSNDGVTRGLDALLTELQRVARYGFTGTELERAKQAMMLGYERVVTESPDRESTSRADEYTRNFLQGEALPTIWQELAFHRRFVLEITLAEINALAGDSFPDRNRLVVSAPEAAGVVLPDRIDTLTDDAIRQAAQRYLNTGNYVKVTLMPAAK